MCKDKRKGGTDMSDENNVYYDNGSPQNEQSNGMGVASMVCGILSIITCCLWYIGLILAIVSLVLGILQIRKSSKKGMAIAGIICSIITIILVIISLVMGSYLMNTGFYQEYMNILQSYGA